MYTRNERVIQVDIENEMKDSYISYAMSVIIGRALPDVRDGLKPVHRRILYAMRELGLEHNKPYKKSARIVGECFVKGTLVLTENGLVPIQDVKRGDKVYTQKSLNAVTELYEMPERELLKITLDNGTHNTVTPSQKIKVLNKDFGLKWKDAKDLTLEDYIVIKACHPDIKRKKKLKRCHKLTPLFLNEDIAYLLGFFMSDGWITKYNGKDLCRIGFSSNRREVVEKIADICMKEFDYIPTIEETAYLLKNKETERVNIKYTARINKRYIVDFLVTNFNLEGLKAPTKKIPQQIFNSPQSVIFAFVSGLIDGDGSIHRSRNIIHYGSVSEELMDSLLLLLQHHGIFGTKYINKSTEPGHINGRTIFAKHRFCYVEFASVNAQLLAAHLNLASRDKRAALFSLKDKRLKKSKHDIIPYAGDNIFNELSKRHLGGGWYKGADGDKFRMGIKYSTGCKIRYSQDLKEKLLRKSQIIDWGIEEKLEKIDSPLYEFLKDLVKGSVYFLKVSSINRVAPECTYDLQVEDEHEFVANGMVAHNCLGKYHPHGDVAVYDSLVRMVQSFSLRYPLIDGQGNFGSIDGDSPAALRYTEARLALTAGEMLSDIDKGTVNFTPNFDGTLEEPSVLPSKLPNLLLNGSSGIAVGMATNIPPHNLGEVADGVAMLIDRPDCAIKDLMKVIKGPDFPTAGIIRGYEGIKSAYLTGRGLLKLHARATFETQKGGKEAIVITEIPYQVNKTNLIESIAQLVQAKKVEGITDLRDESDREGMRIVIELRRDQIPQVTLNQLYKHTQMQVTFGVIMLALVDNRPRTLNLKQVLSLYIDHRKEIIKRRTRFELRKAQERAHILEGLKIALANLDKVIKTIRASKSTPAAKQALIEKFSLSPEQAQAILEMQLQRLTALEREKIDQEYMEMIKRIELYKSILASEKKVLAIIKEETLDIKKRFADARRTEIVAETAELEIEDLIAEEDMVITLSHSGYIKRLPVSSYRQQRRGGVGVTGMGIKEEDFVERLFIASTHDYMLFFTDKGKVYRLKVHEIPQAGRAARGTAVVNLLHLAPSDSISSLIPVKEFREGQFLIMATKNGTIKKTALTAFGNIRKGGIVAITLDENDRLIETKLTDGKQEIFLATQAGISIRFPESGVRDMGRTARGVRGIRLAKKDQCIAMVIVDPKASVLTVSEGGFGKRTLFSSYRVQSRGGKGTINIKITKKNGSVVSVMTVADDDELMMITQSGMIVRCPVKDIRAVGRAAQGVKVISLRDKDKVTSAAKVVAKEEE